MVDAGDAEPHMPAILVVDILLHSAHDITTTSAETEKYKNLHTESAVTDSSGRQNTTDAPHILPLKHEHELVRNGKTSVRL